MVHRFRAEAAQLGLTQNVHDVVTLASIVERETAVDDERPTVASFCESPGRGMPLMTDPSVIYGLQLEGKWRGTIYQSDLTRPRVQHLPAQRNASGRSRIPERNRSMRRWIRPQRIISTLSRPAPIRRDIRFSRSLEEQNKAVEAIAAR